MAISSEAPDSGSFSNTDHAQTSTSSSMPLQESEATFQLLVNSVKDYAIFMLDSQGYIRTWNTGAQRLKGYTKAEIINTHFSIFYPQEARQRNHPAAILETAAREGRFEEEGWRLRKDGTPFWASVVISAVYDEKKQLIGFSKVTRDLSERKSLQDKLLKAHEELQESEERSRLLIASVKDYAIFMLTPQGYIASWNEGAKRIKG
ncbi:PAS domain-containing protein, partial [Cesiribacter andamanensis]|uniref:PAS domain-containing protein n=1 Tax=Cesiribacter andamanensis TaxID=649507 RepID=UPI00191BF40D